MITTKNFETFKEQFDNSADSGDFSDEGLKIIFDYLSENGTEEIEVDVISISLNYREYECLGDWSDDNTEAKVEDIRDINELVGGDDYCFIVRII